MPRQRSDQTKSITEAEFGEDRALVQKVLGELKPNRKLSAVRRRQLRTEIENRFIHQRRGMRCEHAEWADTIEAILQEIAKSIDLTGVRAYGRVIQPLESPSIYSPHDVETSRQSFEETRKRYQQDRQPHVEDFQRQLDELVGTEFFSREERKAIVDQVNATRRLLAVAFLAGVPEQRVSLCVASSSFQLKTSGSKTHIYSGTAFPKILVRDLEGY